MGKGRARVSAAEPGKHSPLSADAVPRRHEARPGIGFARLLRCQPPEDLRRVQLSGRRRSHRIDCRGRWADRATRGHQGTGDLHGDVACLRPRRPARSSTPRTMVRFGTSCGSTSRRGGAKSCCGMPVSATWRSARRTTSLWGIRHLNGICTLVRMPPPYREWYQVVSWPYGTVMYDLDVSPDGARLVASFGEISGQQEVRVFDVAALDTEGRRRRWRQFDFGLPCRTDSCSRADGRSLYGSSYFTGVSNIFRYDLDRRKLDAVTNTETGFFRPVPLAGEEPDRLPLFGRRIRAGAHQATAARRHRPHHVPRRARCRRSIRSSRTGCSALRLTIPSRHPADSAPASTGLPAGCAVIRSIRWSQGYKDTGAVGMRFNFSDPLQLNRASVDGCRILRPANSPHPRAAAPHGGLPAIRLARPLPVERRGLLRSLRSDQDRPQGLLPRRRPQHDADLRRAAPSRSRHRGQRSPEISIACPNTRTSRSTSIASSRSRRTSRTATFATRSATWTTRTGGRGRSSRTGSVVDGTLVPKVLMQPTTAAWRCRPGIRRSGCAAPAGFSPARPGRAVRQFLLRRIRQQLGRPSRREALPCDPQFSRRRAQRDRRPQLREVDRRIEPAALALPPRGHARPSTPPGAGRRFSSAALATNLDAPDAVAWPTNIGAQLDFRFGLLSALDMTMSLRRAVAFEDGYRAAARSDAFGQDPQVDGSLPLRSLPVVLLSGRAVPDGQLQAGAAAQRLLRARWPAAVIGRRGALAAPARCCLDALSAGPCQPLRRSDHRGDGQGLFVVAADRRVRPRRLSGRAAVRALRSAPASLWSRTCTILRALHECSRRALAGARARHGDAARRDDGDLRDGRAGAVRSSAQAGPCRRSCPALRWRSVIHSAFEPSAPAPRRADSHHPDGPASCCDLCVFDRSERATREWVGAGLDLDLEVLQLVVSEHFGVTRFGQYLHELRARFPGPVVADMYCLLRLELELSVQAKALVMARGAGLHLPADEDLEAALAERQYLQYSIGRTGLLALRPLQVTTHRDQWHRHLLERARSRST